MPGVHATCIVVAESVRGGRLGRRPRRRAAPGLAAALEDQPFRRVDVLSSAGAALDVTPCRASLARGRVRSLGVRRLFSMLR